MSYDNGWMFVPKPLGPDRTELRQYWFVAKEADEGKDYDRDNLMALADVTMQEDRELCELVQRGMNNPAYTPGPLNRIHQAYQAGFYTWYAQEMEARFSDILVQLTGVGNT